MAVVLLIEDDDAQRFVAAFALKKAGHQVHEAADGPSGVARALELRPEAIVCDVMMPGMTGYEVVATLRKDPEMGQTPIVLLTAMSDRKHMRQGMTSGADDYLTKPYRPDELCEAVKTVIDRRLNQQEAFLNTMTQVVEGALEEQKEHLGRRYEQQLAKQVNARWKDKADASGDVRYESAVLLQMDLLGPPRADEGDGLAERLKRVHQKARDTLYLFGASHVLPYGSEVVAVFAGGDGSLTVPTEMRAARAALAMSKAAGPNQPVSLGLHAGPVALVALSDPLHGDSGHSLVPGDTLTGVTAVRVAVQQAGWRVGVSAELAQQLDASVPLGTTTATGLGGQAVEVLGG